MTLLSRALLALNPRRRIRAAFTHHYRRQDWWEPETVSGPGSSLRHTATIRQQLPALFSQLGVSSLLDAGCGDFNWFRTMDVTLDRYVGVEVVEELAALDQERYGDDHRRFVALHFTRDELPRVDLSRCRDCLVHLKNRQVVAALRNFRRSGSTYLLATTFGGDHGNEDAPLGGWRPLDLARRPFGLGSPLLSVEERESVEDPRYADKSLGLWRLNAT